MTRNAGSKSTPGIVNDSVNCWKTQIKNIDVALSTLEIRSLKPLHNGDIIKMPFSHAIKIHTVHLEQA